MVQVFFYRILECLWRYGCGASGQLLQLSGADLPRSQEKTEMALQNRGMSDLFRRYNRTAGRALSLPLRQIVDLLPKGTPDNHRLSRDEP